MTEHGAGQTAPPLAFERWLARAALARSLDDTEALLPTAAGTDAQLVADLARTLPRVGAVAVADALSERSRC